MSDWTPSISYKIGDIVTGPAPATVGYTVPESIILSATTAIAFAAIAFVGARVWLLRSLLTPAEALPAIGLLLAAALLVIGVTLIADWRRKRREQNVGATADFKVVATHTSGALSTGLEFDLLDPLDELERHLTAALAVLLREPHLKIDASTIRMLTKFKDRRPVVRDEKGRWRSVQ